MKRRDFVRSASALTALSFMDLKAFAGMMSELPAQEASMPVLFAGHGSPMNAIEDNEFTRGWKAAAAKLPTPKAILCVSAHWETKGTQVTAMKMPPTIHDFGGFPEKLFQQQYPAPGSPELAGEIKHLVKKTEIALDEKWGLDHGTWSVIMPMFPKADIPVLQLSIDYTKDAKYHFELAKELAALRKKGVLIVGSGNIVHNLGMMQWKDGAYDWTIEFDTKIKDAILKEDWDSLINYRKFGRAADLSVPSNEHYLPLLYIAALKDSKDKTTFFNEKNTMGSISMRSVVFHG